MIHINLLGEKVDNSSSYFAQVVGFGCSVALTLAICFFTYGHLSNSLESLQTEKETLEARLVKLKKVTAEVEGLEKNKLTLAEKLSTIAVLKAKKQGPVHILDDLNVAIPDRAWITTIKDQSGSLQISGIAMDNQTIADFMHRLEESNYFGKIDLGHSTQYIKDEVKLKEFSVIAKIENPLALAAEKITEKEKEKKSKAKGPDKKAAKKIIKDQLEDL